MVSSNSGYAPETNPLNALWFSARETLAPYVNIDRAWETAQQNKEYVIAGTIVTATALALGIIKCCCNKKKPAPRVPETAAKAAAAGTAALATGPNASVTPAAGAKSPAAATTVATVKSPAAGSASAAAAGVGSPAAGAAGTPASNGAKTKATGPATSATLAAAAAGVTSPAADHKGKDFKAGTPASQTAAGSAGAATAADKKVAAAATPIAAKPRITTRDSGLGALEVTIETPRVKPKRLELTVTIIIDTSVSMGSHYVTRKTNNPENPDETKEFSRLDEVVEVVKNDILGRIQEKVSAAKDAQVRLGIGKFDTTTSWVVEPILLASNMLNDSKGAKSDQKDSKLTKTLRDITTRLDALKADGAATEILQAHTFGVNAVQDMAKTIEGAQHLLMVLTDGDQVFSAAHKALAQQNNQTLEALKVKSYVVGIGLTNALDPEKLRQALDTLSVLAPSARENGRFINASSGNDTIESAMKEALEMVLPEFRQCIASPLPAKAWQVNGLQSQPYKDGRSVFYLRNMKPNAKRVRFITLDPNYLDAKLDGTVPEFQFFSTDPNGLDDQQIIRGHGPITPSIHHALLKAE